MEHFVELLGIGTLQIARRIKCRLALIFTARLFLSGYTIIFISAHCTSSTFHFVRFHRAFLALGIRVSIKLSVHNEGTLCMLRIFVWSCHFACIQSMAAYFFYH